MTRPLTTTEQQVFNAALKDNDAGITTNEYRCVPDLKTKTYNGCHQFSKRHIEAYNRLIQDGFLVEVTATPMQGRSYVVSGHPLLKQIAEAVDIAKAQQNCDRLRQELDKAEQHLQYLKDFKRKYG